MPYLPQWLRLMKSITFERMHRVKAKEKAYHVSQYIWFSRWKQIKVTGRRLRDMKNAIEVAWKHYNTSLTFKVLTAWYQLVRSKGRTFRLREKIFYAWKIWSPKKKKMRIAKEKVLKFMNFQRVRRCFTGLLELCHDLMARRLASLKELRSRMYDRKILICAYSIMGLNSHMMMLDCWRRWLLWQKNRCRWKAAAMSYRCTWYFCRNRGNFISL